MWYIMDWKWYLGLSLATYATGLVGGWALAKWEEAYKEAKNEGVVA